MKSNKTTPPAAADAGQPLDADALAGAFGAALGRAGIGSALLAAFAARLLQIGCGSLRFGRGAKWTGGGSLGLAAATSGSGAGSAGKALSIAKALRFFSLYRKAFHIHDNTHTSIYISIPIIFLSYIYTYITIHICLLAAGRTGTVPIWEGNRKITVADQEKTTAATPLCTYQKSLQAESYY